VGLGMKAFGRGDAFWNMVPCEALNTHCSLGPIRTGPRNSRAFASLPAAGVRSPAARETRMLTNSARSALDLRQRTASIRCRARRGRHGFGSNSRNSARKHLAAKFDDRIAARLITPRDHFTGPAVAFITDAIKVVCGGRMVAGDGGSRRHAH